MEDYTAQFKAIIDNLSDELIKSNTYTATIDIGTLEELAEIQEALALDTLHRSATAS